MAFTFYEESKIYGIIYHGFAQNYPILQNIERPLAYVTNIR